MPEEIGELELRRFQYSSRGSTVEMRRQNAVCVRHSYKHYGFLKNSINVLDNLSMTVPRGCIYGLLGASGCGKTTLINCIVGRKRLNSGEIWVLGGAPDTKGSGVPGPEIGFMPQQISLFGEFTIRETMKYFGWITNMKTRQIEERLEFLAELLQLPDVDRQVNVLSGGQQRRVSLAVALLHEPELLILDEPTVGLDPILREIIWNHLLKITRTKHTTVILTTHYIDETKQANLIGLMRGGYIIAEESPRTLLIHCGTETLEEAFLKLSVLQNMSRHRRSSIAQEVTNAISIPPGIVNQTAVMDNIDSDNVPEISGEFGDNVSGSYGNRRASILSIKDISPIPLPEPRKTTVFDYLLNFKMNRINALLWKNYLWFLRNMEVLFMILTMPPVVTLLFFVTIGNNITGLKVALVNHETKNVPCNQAVSCNATQLSCSYLGYLQNRSLDLIPYDSEDEAVQSVLRGETYASIVVRHNYTAALKRRVESYAQADPWSIIYSTIDVVRDVSVKDIAIIIKIHLYEGLKVFLEDYMQSCGENAEALSPPIKFKPPVYGAPRPLYSDFITPALLLTVTFTLAMALTAVVLLAERKESILERALVVGVNPIEILISHVVVNVGVVIGQTILTLAVTFAIYKMTMTGSLFLVTLLTLLSGICGMCFGFVISCGCDDEIMAMSIAAGVFLPTALVSGLIWPVEGMHIILQKIAIVLPFTKPTESMRSVLQRGWGFSEPAVHQGFISLIVWIIIFLIISILCLKFKKG